MERYHILKCLTYFKRFAIGSLLKLHFLFLFFFSDLFLPSLSPWHSVEVILLLSSQILPKQNKALSLSNQSEASLSCHLLFPVEQERRLCYSVYQELSMRPCFPAAAEYHPSTHEVGGAREGI